MKFSRIGAEKVLIEPITEKEHDGIVLPYEVRKMDCGKILGIGKIHDSRGREIRPELHVGDIVYHEPYVGQELEDDTGKTLLFLPYNYIKGVRDELSRDVQSR